MLCFRWCRALDFNVYTPRTYDLYDLYELYDLYDLYGLLPLEFMI